MFDDFITQIQSDELAALKFYEEQDEAWAKEMMEDFEDD